MSRKSYQLSILLITLFLLSWPVHADELKTINIQDANNQIIGFIDEGGQYHELGESISSSNFPDSEKELAIQFSTSSYDLTALDVLGTKTIDRMTFSNYYYDTYSSGGRLLLIDDADRYYLNDGSSWSSGAGSFSSSGAYFDRVEVEGYTLRFYLKNPSDFRRTDYNGGDHSAQGTLRPLTPLVIEATIGSTTGRLIGTIELISNDATWYGEPRFNYFSAPVGAVLPFEITYTLLYGATFNQNLFNNSFKYKCSGSVDFANPISVPLPVSLEIKGPQKILENSSVQYTAVATYDNGIKKNVTETTVWYASPVSLASVNQGLLTTGSLTGDSELITLTAVFEYSGVTVNAELAVTCLREGDIFPDNSWPMFQGNKEHNGYVPMSLDTADFTKKWEYDFGRSLNPVAAAEGKVLVSTPSRFQDADSLFVLDDRDGELLWSKNLGTASSVNPPSYAYGNVYIQTGKGTSSSPPPYVSAFDAETGAEVFRAVYSAQWESHYAPTIYKGSVYVNGGYYGGMYRYDAFDGSQKWFTSLAQYDDWTPAVDENYSYAYVGGLLSIVDRLNGQVVGSIRDPDFDWQGWSMNLAPVIGECNDILTGYNGRLKCFDLDTRTMKYQIVGSFTNQPSVAHGCVFGINGGMLDVRDECSGEQLWTWTPPEGQLSGNVIITDTHVLTATSANTYAVELLAQDADWSYPAAGHLALGNETLYIAGGNGVLTAIATPEYIPATPVKLKIEGPDDVFESSTNAYQATVYYSDGRIRNRTALCNWTLMGTALAAIDQGSLSIGELLYPQETIVLRAEYTQDETTVVDEKEVTIHISGTVCELVTRNLEGALKLKQEILLDTERALARERASADIIKGTHHNLCDINNPDLNKSWNQTHLAIVREKAVEKDLEKSIVNLSYALEIFSGESAYLEDMEQFKNMLKPADDEQLRNADINGDGKINMLDMSEISRFWLMSYQSVNF